jgi:hypothetical protein
MMLVTVTQKMYDQKTNLTQTIYKKNIKHTQKLKTSKLSVTRCRTAVGEMLVVPT